MATVNDGLRMMGHLLLHHPTTGEYARGRDGFGTSARSVNASCFCFLGALQAVGHALQFRYYEQVEFENKAKWVAGCRGWANWDNATPERRIQIATRLTKVTDP